MEKEDRTPVGSDSDISSISSIPSSNPDSSSVTDNIKKYTSLAFSLSNARSLAKKVDSMIDMFRERTLSFAMITETWFKNDRYTNRELENISSAEKIEFICKNRSNNKRGGGVAIAYDSTKASFKKLQIQENKFELVGAVGKINNLGRKCIIFALYIPPNLCADKTKSLLRCLGNAIEQVKQDYIDPMIIIGGDTNKRDLQPALDDFPDIILQQTGPTRGTATLDVVATNFSSKLALETFFPLETYDSASTSDHLSIIGTAEIENCHVFETKSFQTRKYSAEAEAAFGADLVMLDWALVTGETPTATAGNLDLILQHLYNKHFPLRTVTSQSCDPRG